MCKMHLLREFLTVVCEEKSLKQSNLEMIVKDRKMAMRPIYG